MTEFLIFDIDATFRAILERVEVEGAFDREAYDDLIDEVLEEKRAGGELSDDDDIAEYTEQLKARWPEAEESIQTGHDKTILDQE